MYLLIDRLNDITGWTGSGAVLNEIEDYIAHGNNASILINTAAGGVYEKAISITPGEYEYLSLSIQSLYNGLNNYFNPSEFLHKITFGTTYFYLPVFPTLRQAVFKIPVGETLNKIRIESTGSDSIIISHLQLIKENPIADAMNSIKDSIDVYEKQVGTLTVTAGSKSINVSGLDYMQKSVRIKIGNEYHVIDDIDGTTARFTDDYDGKSIQNNYTNEPVYIS